MPRRPRLFHLDHPRQPLIFTVKHLLAASLVNHFLVARELLPPRIPRVAISSGPALTSEHLRRSRLHRRHQASLRILLVKLLLVASLMARILPVGESSPLHPPKAAVSLGPGPMPDHPLPSQEVRRHSVLLPILVRIQLLAPLEGHRRVEQKSPALHRTRTASSWEPDRM